MRPLDLVKSIQQPLQQIELPATRAIGYLDICIGFMLRPQSATNPAIAAVRAPIVVGAWMISVLMMVALIWGGLAPIESGARARGSVVLYNSKKTIQHLEGGIIQEILVKEGDQVTEGQQLIRLRDTTPNANRDALQKQLFTELATQSRLTSLRDHQNAVMFDTNMVEESKTNPELADIIINQQRMFESEHDEQYAKLAELSQRAEQTRAEIKGMQAQDTGAADQLALLDREIANVEKLYEKGYATETRLLALKRNRSELTGTQGQYEAQAAKMQQGITETDMAVINQQKDYENKNLQELHDTQLKITELRDKLRAAEDVEGRTIITAPTEGIVTGLKYHTAGGVIPPGSTIMDIVPQNDSLIVEAHLRPTDIANIQQGMPARVTFSSYKQRTTPKIPGKVTQISADVFTDEHASPPSSYYTARIEVDKEFLKHLARPIDLRPGLPVDVMINTGSRSFLSYLLRPVSDSMQSAFREQ